ncbi:MAG: hypothetical protein K2N94_08625 [Lachnospiraceae bacterium]|nr:hypothetical protein [Lachnospiraceae bacterium]
MPEQEYFRQALADFAFDAAGGDAVRHLADLGYTVRQITERLTFPLPCGKVGEIVWKHLVDTGIVLLEEPGNGRGRTAGTYVKEYDAYGRQSFRFSPAADSGLTGGEGKIVFREVEFSCAEQERQSREHSGSTPGRRRRLTGGEGREMPCAPGNIPNGREKELLACLVAKCAENGEEASYISCDFGMRGMGAQDSRTGHSCCCAQQNLPAGFSLLDSSEQDYILGLPWERRACYHRLNRRMREITTRLYAGGGWQAACYFLKTKEKLRIR